MDSGPRRVGASLPFERSFLPRIGKPEAKLDEEDDHRSPSAPAGEIEADCPGEQERRLEIEHDEQDRDQIEADVELGASVLESWEAALIFAELLRIWLVRTGQPSNDHRQHDERT